VLLERAHREHDDRPLARQRVERPARHLFQTKYAQKLDPRVAVR
jgi:hypothetical protein